MDRNINWSTNNAHRAFSNVPVPEPGFRTSQVWLAEMNETDGTGVEIIELHSRDGSQPDASSEHVQGSHLWSYDNSNGLDFKHSYAANQQARLKRRLKNKNLFTANDSFDSECDDSFYFNTQSHSSEEVTFNPNMNSFTFMERHSPRSSDSQEIEDASEPMRCGDVVLENEYNGNGGYEEVISYNSPSDGMKRTIWIYSFKNRRLLAENDFELENIPSGSTTCSTSGSPELEDMTSEKFSHTGRAASPIPKTYIPRLDLSSVATLPNVTEVTEPKSSHNLKEQFHISKKPANGWIMDKTKKLEEVSKQSKSTDVVNWMALSPRERRRRSRHTNADIQNVTQLSALKPIAEVTSNTATDEKIKTEPFPEITEEVISKAASPIITQRSVRRSPFSRNSVVESPGPRGDYKIPHIKLDRKTPLVSSAITEPIENLESHLWIIEEPKPRQESVRDYRGAVKDSSRVEISTPCAGDKLMARNIPLLKPADWRAYAPIAGSQVSLELSLGLNSEADGTSLLQRCISCFKCCKYRFH